MICVMLENNISVVRKDYNVCAERRDCVICYEEKLISESSEERM